MRRVYRKRTSETDREQWNSTCRLIINARAPGLRFCLTIPSVAALLRANRYKRNKARNVIRVSALPTNNPCSRRCDLRAQGVRFFVYTVASSTDSCRWKGEQTESTTVKRLFARHGERNRRSRDRKFRQSGRVTLGLPQLQRGWLHRVAGNSAVAPFRGRLLLELPGDEGAIVGKQVLLGNVGDGGRELAVEAQGGRVCVGGGGHQAGGQEGWQDRTLPNSNQNVVEVPYVVSK